MPEELKGYKLGIWDETNQLQEALMFEPGLEAYLGTLLPQEESLFFDSFDIVKGKKEFENLVQILQELGVNVHNGRDILGTHPNFEPINAVSSQQIGDIEKASEFGLIHSITKKYPKADFGTVSALFYSDATKYGLNEAYALNYWLSFGTPLCNMYFSRDQFNVVGNKLVASKMKFPIRQPEVTVAAYILDKLGIHPDLEITGPGTFEGGDMIVWNGAVYIGNGMRTSQHAIEQILPHIPKGYDLFAVKSPNGSFTEEMEIMHLDTYFMPVDKRAVLMCPEVAEQCTVFAYGKNSFHSHGNLLNTIENQGYKVLPVPKGEQKYAAANLLVVKPGEVIVPLSSNGRTISALKEHGANIHYAEIKQLTQGWGGVHCMVGQLSRGE